MTSVLDERFPEVESLTEQQKKALFAVLMSRKDVFTILQTGHRKSIIFQLLPDVCKYLPLRGYSYPRHAIILVVCPLKSLVDSHIRELSNCGNTRELTQYNKHDFHPNHFKNGSLQPRNCWAGLYKQTTGKLSLARQFL